MVIHIRIDLHRPAGIFAFVFPRFRHVLLIVALLAATGVHWTLLQAVAWSNMLAQNLETDSILEALTKTFDGKHPCLICKQIAAAKKSEKKAKFPPINRKMNIIHAPSQFVFAAPMVFWLQYQWCANADALPRTPPVPPPRSLLG